MSFRVHDAMHFWSVIPMLRPAQGDAYADDGRVQYSRSRGDACRIASAMMTPDQYGNREYCKCLIIPPLKKLLMSPESGAFIINPLGGENNAKA